MGLIKRICKNEYLVGIVLNVANLFVNILYSALIARYLGAAIKGETAYISSVAGIVSTILMFAMHQTYAFYRKNDENIKDKYMTNLFVVFGVYIAIGAGVSLFYFNDITMLATVAFSVLGAYVGIVNYVYLIEHSVKRNFVMFVVNWVHIAYVILLMIFTKPNLFWGITNLMFVELALSVMCTIKLKVKFSVKNIDMRFILKTFKFGIVPMLTIMASRLNYNMDVLMLKAFPNVHIEDIGVYSLGLMLAQKVLIIPDTLKGILLSRLAKGRTADEVARVMRMCLPVCIMMIGGLALLGQPVIDLIYGPEYKNAYDITMITMFGVCALMFYNMIETYNVVNKKQHFTLIVLVSSIVVNFVLNYILIPKYASIGAAFATFVSYVYCAGTLMIIFAWHTKIKFRKLLFVTSEDIAMIRNLFSRKS